MSPPTLGDALPAPQEVVVVAAAAAVVEHLAPAGVDVEGEPLLHAVARAGVDGTEAGPRRPLSCDITASARVCHRRHRRTAEVDNTSLLPALSNISRKSGWSFCLTAPFQNYTRISLAFFIINARVKIFLISRHIILILFCFFH